MTEIDDNMQAKLKDMKQAVDQLKKDLYVEANESLVGRFCNWLLDKVVIKP